MKPYDSAAAEAYAFSTPGRPSAPGMHSQPFASSLAGRHKLPRNGRTASTGGHQQKASIDMRRNIHNKIRKKVYEIRKYGLFYVVRKYFYDHVYSRREVIILRRHLMVPAEHFDRKRRWTTALLECVEDLKPLERSYPSKRKVFSKHIQIGAFCVVPLVGDRAVGYCWFIGSDYYDDWYKYQFELEDSEALEFAGFLDPEYRRTLIPSDVMEYGWDHLRKLGYKRILAAVDLDDPLAIRIHLRWHFQETGRLFHFYKLLFYRWTVEKAYSGTLLDHVRRKRKG